MDSDWCLFCEKHVMEPGAAYCSKECARMEKQKSVMSFSDNNSQLPATTCMSTSSSFLTPVPSSSSCLPAFKRFSNSTTMSSTPFPSMYRSSTLAPTNRGGISKNNGSQPLSATTSLRSLPITRSSTRRQPLVLHGF